MVDGSVSDEDLLEGLVRVECRWETAGRLPYFANLKVMRGVLSCLRHSLRGASGVLGAYGFVEDAVVFVAEGSPGALERALEGARSAAESRFAASDRKALWGERRERTVSGLGREEAVRQVLRLPVDAGLVEEPRDYPWLGGPWLGFR